MSDRAPEVPRGVIPIVVTPFARDGSVDVAQFDRQIDFLPACGVRWAGFGFGSEVPRLTSGELSTLMARAVTRGGDALRVIGNAELTSVRAGVDAVRRVADAGADAAMVRPAGMSGVPEAAVAAAIADVATGGGLPVVVQDAPQNTGVALSAATLAWLITDVPDVVAVKVESPGPAAKIAAVTEALAGASVAARSGGAAGAVLGGLGGQDFWHELRRGAAGTMPGPAFPEVFQAVQRRYDAGDEAGAFGIWSRALPLIVFCLRDPQTFLVAQKYLLTRRGVLDGHALRPPHDELDPHLLADLDVLTDSIELWELVDESRE